MPQPVSQRRLAALFIASGFTAVAYQVLLSRYLQLVVGVTAYAVSALLVAFLLGIATGSVLGGRFADRVSRPLRVYAVAEGLVGLYCLSFPAFFPALQELYLSFAGGLEAGGLQRDIARFVLGVAAFLPPSLLMGATTPAFARAVTGGRLDAGEQLVRLYGWNTLGAAFGALLTAYVSVPILGVRGGMAVMAAGNALVCALAWRAAGPVAPAAADRTPAGPADAGGTTTWGSAVLMLAFGTGFVSFALEVVWTHLLAVLIGNSVYAFGLMLGCLLLGLYAGSLAARPLARRATRAADGVGWALAGAGATVLLTLGVWDEVPRVFLLLATASPSFFTLEATRFAVALLLMGLPTALLGVSFPLILSAAAGRTVAGRVGALYAVNTVGSVLGAVFAPYVLLRLFGSLESLRALGCLLALMGSAALLALARSRVRQAGAALALVVAPLGWVWPVHWELGRLSSAASIYLGRSESSRANLVFVQEHPTGGLVTVAHSHGVKTLLTNGKFEGDDADEVPIQHRLAHIPPLFTAGRERALVIGLGTGVTLRALAAHGFRETVCAEISQPIIAAARREFAQVNGGVLDQPGVRLVPEDGRSVLSESPARYDVVSVEVTTIWFAGVGNIYSREFYSLAARRLRHNGVLLQWFPIHHLSVRNLYVVVNTVRSVFPYVSVWTHRHQGFVVASLQPLEVDLESVRADAGRASMAPFLQEFETGSPLELLSDLAITDTDADSFLDALAGLLNASRDLVSTDTWPTLEYETPRDIQSHFSYFQNRGLLARFRSAAPAPLRGRPTPVEQALARAAFAHGWGQGALATLASAWAETGGDAAIARWALAEAATTNPGSRDQAAPIADLLSLAGSTAECAPERAPVSLPPLPLSVLGVAAQPLRGSQPEGLVDGNDSPLLGHGFWARSRGGRPIEIDLDARGASVSAVEVAFEQPAGEALGFGILGRGMDGRWRPFGTATAQAGACPVWRFGLAEPQRLSALRVFFEPQSTASELGVFEIRAEP